MDNEDVTGELRRAACYGDMEALGKALATQPVDNFLTLFPSYGGQYNLIHIAILMLKKEFLRELISKLPPKAVHFLISQQDNIEFKQNALHYAVLHGNVEILRVLLDFYRSKPSLEGVSLQKPWVAVDRVGKTSLQMALGEGKDDCALEIMSMDMELFCNLVDDDGNSLLFEAVRKRCPKVAVKILTFGRSYIISGHAGLTPLHVAPKSTEEVCKLVLDKHPEMIKKSDQFGNTVLHVWVKIRFIWPFHLLLNRVEQTSSSRKDFLDLLCATDVDGNNPLHVAAKSFDEDTINVAKLLIKAYIEAYDKLKGEVHWLSPWRRENLKGETPLMTALISRHEELALYLLSLDLASLVFYESKSALYYAVSHGCDRAVEKMLLSFDPLTFQNKSSLIKNLEGCGENVLHAASYCTETTANLLVEILPWLINEPDENGKRPLDTASEVGAPWLIELLITTDPSSITSAPYSWTYACKSGNLAAINAFINQCPDFRNHCLKLKDTPLHHIELKSYREYKDFTAIPMIEEMKNVVDKEGATPLHHAIRRKDVMLAEVLLTTPGVDRSLKDKHGKTATDLLAEIQDSDWDAMCKRISINPRLRTRYIPQTGINMNRLDTQGSSSTPGEMRSTLSVVAALLATLTFAAGFTLPGGFNNDTGNAILSRKASFIVFILADTYAMCCAMLVLFCLIWSMVCDNDKFLILIDSAVVLLMQSLYGTLVAFMTGVYTVVSHKSLWAAILVIVMCSLVGVSANKTILYKLLDNLIHSAHRKAEYRV